ncbi:hypothetical protein M430DRAFT_27698 [Amorphotheca resinae ATCC 22711]|uniref:V-type proton ATPase subunit G n=1 Tax=Amorphotheca resinae ATCC 22711 TaxID=857342 RepID=A0A2T3B4V4_AMORE|nr:hypothetical protein M430DRAFT_27698 [Amorphotheca resinae ATCC 22711]PSS20679.1 hypothetical protein M430DRAFT_27698 [Amorphotheca resinae ATCC 22711]
MVLLFGVGPDSYWKREEVMVLILQIIGREGGTEDCSKSSRMYWRWQGLIRTDRTKRVKEARDEAKKEIDEYRKAKEAEFKKFELEHTSGNKKAEEEANKDAEAQIKQIQQAGKKGQDQVVKDLLKAVFDIKPVVPERIEVPK